MVILINSWLSFYLNIFLSGVDDMVFFIHNSLQLDCDRCHLLHTLRIRILLMIHLIG